jgi:hypothetical protein
VGHSLLRLLLAAIAQRVLLAFGACMSMLCGMAHEANATVGTELLAYLPCRAVLCCAVLCCAVLVFMISGLTLASS